MTDGGAWSSTINLPYAILAQGFSPGGNIGFAIGISATNPSFDQYKIKDQGGSQTLSMNKSVDHGATWTEFETDETFYGYPWAMAFSVRQRCLRPWFQRSNEINQAMI